MFYTRFKEACDRKDIKPTKLVTELGMSQGNLSKWKAGGAPKADTLAKIAERLDVSAAYLLEQTSDIENSPMPSDGTGDMLDKKISLLSETERAQIERQVDEFLIRRLSGQ